MHAAIVMDGCEAWARAHQRPRTAGHEAGALAATRLLRVAPEFGIDVLTLFALGSASLERSPAAARELFDTLRSWLEERVADSVRDGVRLCAIGRRDRLPDELVASIQEAEVATAAGAKLCVRLAIDASARDAIVRAARHFHASVVADDPRASFATLLSLAANGDGAARDVDLLIRCGGERRLSDFLLWECAHAEVVFRDTTWPDFDRAELARCVAQYHARAARLERSSAGRAG